MHYVLDFSLSLSPLDVLRVMKLIGLFDVQPNATQASCRFEDELDDGS